MSSPLNVESIRAGFPALSRMEAGRPVAYFDGPGGTQAPRPVLDAVLDYLAHHNANTHWAYPTSEETDRILAGARSALADFVGGRDDEIAFGANMTTLTFHLARALGRRWQRGDAVVVTELDHHANIAPWRALERERGVVLRTVRMDPASGTLDADDLARQISGGARLLAIGAASNAIGTISDVARAARLAHDAGALVFVDAVHYAPHARVDVTTLGCDFLACSAYKFYGPHVGVLWGRRELIEALEVPKLEPAPDRSPERLETGTQNHEGIAGAAAAVDFLAGLGTGAGRRERLTDAFARLHDRSTALFRRLRGGLADNPAVRLYGPPSDAPRTPTVAFGVRDREPAEVARALARRGVFVSHGDFYATTAVRRLGAGDAGLVRAGCACYTTEDEIDRLIDAVSSL